MTSGKIVIVEVASKDIADAVVYLTEDVHVSGEVLQMDDGAHSGQW